MAALASVAGVTLTIWNTLNAAKSDAPATKVQEPVPAVSLDAPHSPLTDSSEPVVTESAEEAPEVQKPAVFLSPSNPEPVAPPPPVMPPPPVDTP